MSYTTRGTPSLSELTGVEITDPSNNDHLSYNNGIWENKSDFVTDEIDCRVLRVSETADVGGRLACVGVASLVNDKFIFQNGISNLGDVVYIDNVNNRVGINKAVPEEDLDVDGNIQINTSGLGKLVFYDNNDDHEHAEIDADDDGTNGGQFIVKTKVDGGSVTEKLRINNAGAIGIAGANYGTSGQVLTSNGASALPSWTTIAEPYYFLAKMTASQTISNTTYTDITNLVIDSNATSSSASSDFASNRWTPSTSGVYFISCNVKVFPTGGTPVTAGNISRIIFVFADTANNQIRSGETMNEENADGTDIYGKTLSINGVIYLTAGTTYKLRVWVRRSPSASSQVLYGSGTRTDTFFSAYKIG